MIKPKLLKKLHSRVSFSNEPDKEYTLPPRSSTSSSEDSNPKIDEERWTANGTEDQEKKTNVAVENGNKKADRRRSQDRKFSATKLKGLSFSDMLSENNKTQNKLLKKTRGKIQDCPWSAPPYSDQTRLSPRCGRYENNTSFSNLYHDYRLEFFKMTDKGLLLTKILELYPVKAEYVRAILDSHKIDEDGSIKATELLEFFKTLYVDDALRNDDTININKLRSEVEAFELQIKNNDNRIKISDLALLLPQKERLFLKFISFCRKQITSVEFFELLLKYATDKSGKISQDQLYKMVKDFADEIGAPEDHCNDCVRYILALFNADDESTLDMFEFPRLFNIEGNFLKKLKPHGRFSAVDFDNIIKHYDRDGNGTIDAGGELMALIADVLEYADIRVNGELLFEMVDAALDLCEKTNLQKLGSEDLKVILTQLPKQRMG